MLNPSVYGCAKCSTAYPMGAETKVFVYTKQPWFNHLLTTCPNCKAPWIVWWLTPQQIEYLSFHNMTSGDEITFSIIEFAPDSVETSFCQCNGLKLIAERTISATEQAHIDAQVAFATWELEKGELWET